MKHLSQIGSFLRSILCRTAKWLNDVVMDTLPPPPGVYTDNRLVTICSEKFFVFGGKSGQGVLAFREGPFRLILASQLVCLTAVCEVKEKRGKGETPFVLRTGRTKAWNRQQDQTKL